VQTGQDLEFSFRAGRAGSATATWGQHAKWEVIRHLGTDAARYNVTGGSPVSPPLPARRIGEIVAALALRHDSLRTRLRAAGERPEQTVYADGGFPVFIRRCGPQEITETSHLLYFAMQDTAFDPERDWPVRIGLIESGGLVHYVIFSMIHTAADGWGLRYLLADFAAGCAGPAEVQAEAPAELLQPLEEARFQASPRGLRRDTAARRSWREKLSAAPARQFAAGQAPAGKFPNAVLNSPALALASEWVSEKYAVSPAAVLLAAASAQKHRLTGVPEALFQVVVNNRFLSGMDGAVNVVAQEGLFHLTGTHESFSGLLGRAFGATLSAHRHAYYDKQALDRDLEQMRQHGGPVADHSCVLNDLRGLMPSLGFGKAAPEPLARALSRTTLTWPVEFEPRPGLSFALDAQDSPGSVELAMTADSALLPRAGMERFLLGVEELIVTEAMRIGHE
jgi:hypothetical protein